MHSKIGASSMYRWSQCPGSVKLSEGIESTPSKYAEEGTKAHELAAKWLAAGRMNYRDKDYDTEMKEHVETYFNTVWDDAHGNDILVEQHFDLSSIHPGLYGTADAVVYDPTSKILRVYDLKYGAGILVDVNENPQLQYYGLGALLHTKFPAAEVELVIVQPRANHVDGAVRRWRFKSFELVEFASELENYAKKTTEKNAPLVEGDHCRFCPAVGICPKLKETALSVAQKVFSPSLSYDPRELGETLKKLDALEAYTKGVREFAYQEAEHGRCPPGWKLVEKRGVRKWSNPISAETTLSNGGFALKQDDIYEEPKLKSPAQIEKLLDKQQRKQLGELVVMVSSGTTLVEENDPRPAVGVDLTSNFKPITDINELFG